ncbi:MAG: SpoVG family protein [Clostridiales bacterium]|nr:SpoVG family protein [Clostridiales bacterium]
MNFDVNIHKTFEDGKPLKAICSVTMDGQFAVHGVRLFKKEKGSFIAMPNESYKDAKGNTQYKDVFHPITNEARRAMEAAVFKAYDAKVKA